MSRNSTGPRDLFGNPWTPERDPRGRKSHKRTSQGAEKVAVLRASGHTVEEIAVRVGLSEPTLRKYYFRELDRGPVLAEAVLDELLWAKAKGGNVSAMRTLKAMFEKGRAAVPVGPRRASPPAGDKLGKKAQADADAATAHEGTSWGGLLQ